MRKHCALLMAAALMLAAPLPAWAQVLDLSQFATKKDLEKLATKEQVAKLNETMISVLGELEHARRERAEDRKVLKRIERNVDELREDVDDLQGDVRAARKEARKAYAKAEEAYRRADDAAKKPVVVIHNNIHPPAYQPPPPPMPGPVGFGYGPPVGNCWPAAPCPEVFCGPKVWGPKQWRWNGCAWEWCQAWRRDCAVLPAFTGCLPAAAPVYAIAPPCSRFGF